LNIFDFGISLIQSIQGWGEWLATPMKLITLLGNEQFFLLLLPLLYWCVDSKLGIQVGFALMMTGAFNDIFKLIFHMPRPYWYSQEVHPYAAETSFGAPSGHSQKSSAILGVIAAYLHKPWAWITALLIIFLIGLSRLYLGVHFPHDVLLGWLFGFIILWLTLRFWEPVAAYLRKLSLGKQVLLAFSTSMVLVVLGLIPYLWLRANYSLPVEWTRNAAHFFTGDDMLNPIDLEGTLGYAGTLFGFAAGLAWITPRGGFIVDGPFWKRLLRYLLGVVGLLVLWKGLGSVFDLVQYQPLSFLLRYLRYALLGFWVSAGAPLLFLSLKLVQKKS
jgi:membrane-associated phospholipid phosphatase